MEAGLGKSLEGKNARGLKKVADRARHWCILLMGAENRLTSPSPFPSPLAVGAASRRPGGETPPLRRRERGQIRDPIMLPIITAGLRHHELQDIGLEQGDERDDQDHGHAVLQDKPEDGAFLPHHAGGRGGHRDGLGRNHLPDHASIRKKNPARRVRCLGRQGVITSFSLGQGKVASPGGSAISWRIWLPRPPPRRYAGP